MNNLYGDEYVSKLNKRKSGSVRLVVAIMLFATLVNIGLLLLSNEYNALLIKIVTSVIYVGAGWVSIFLICNGVLACKKKLVAVEDLTCNEVLTEKTCIIQKVDKPKTLSYSVRYYEITALENGKENKLFFDESFDASAFIPGTTVRFCVSKNNYIIAYEVVGNEK